MYVVPIANTNNQYYAIKIASSKIKKKLISSIICFRNKSEFSWDGAGLKKKGRVFSWDGVGFVALKEMLHKHNNDIINV